jgi:uncharacterized iron-regulated protein
MSRSRLSWYETAAKWSSRSRLEPANEPRHCPCFNSQGAAEPEAATEPCVALGSWLNPGDTTPQAHDAITRSMAERPVVLLGEQHDDAGHHRWQLQMLAGLYAHQPDMVIGFEMFPRASQKALDRWVAGELDEAAFLKEAGWANVWGFGANLYLPMFHFARQNGIPMIALNVDRSLVSRVGKEGWDAVPANERHGLGDPAPARTHYLEYLARIYALKETSRTKRDTAKGEGESSDRSEATESSKPDLDAIMARDDFQHFVAAQLTWDRAMAEALAGARGRHPNALVVGVIGRGHLDHRDGVPHQLADLGIADAAVLLPVAPKEACAAEVGLADLLFVTARERQGAHGPPKPRLGVLIDTQESGVVIMQVVEGSVAERAGLLAGDIVLSAAGVNIAAVPDLITVIQRQAPGTWLPLAVRRGEIVRAVVAEFPAARE